MKSMHHCAVQGAASGKARGRLRHGYEVVASPEALQTPREMFEALAARGYALTYRCACLRAVCVHWRAQARL